MKEEKKEKLIINVIKQETVASSNCNPPGSCSGSGYTSVGLA